MDVIYFNWHIARKAGETEAVMFDSMCAICYVQIFAHYTTINYDSIRLNILKVSS